MVYACTDGVYRDTRRHLSTSGSHNRNARQVADVENNFITSCKHIHAEQCVINLLLCAARSSCNEINYKASKVRLQSVVRAVDGSLLYGYILF